VISSVNLVGKKVILTPFTKELWHEFYKDYVPDPMMDTNPYTYNFEKGEENYYLKTNDNTRLYFTIMCEGKIVGQIYLKNINNDDKSAEISIALSQNSFKNKGAGTEASLLLIGYALNSLGFEKLAATSVLRNARSQHVLEKIGFKYTHEDEKFKHYEILKKER